MDTEKININLIVKEVLKRISEAENETDKNSRMTAVNSSAQPDHSSIRFSCTDGVFERMEDAIEAAYKAQLKLMDMSVEGRNRIISAMRKSIIQRVHDIAKLAVEETGLGKVDDKVGKNLLAAEKTPGTEDIIPKTYTGDYGFTLVEQAPYGVIGAITPSTNPSETVICNGIGMIAAGNSVVFNAHPGAKKVTQLTVRILNQAITEAGGPENLLCVISEPTMDTGKILMTHPKIRLLVVTGGPEIVRIAMGSGKKVIAAGPGNPPVVVDETADIGNAAKCIVDGASFDNNVLCIAEKEVFVVDRVADQLIRSMVGCGAFLLKGEQLESLMSCITVKNSRGETVPNKKYVGKDVHVILGAIGVNAPADVKLAIAEVRKDHPLVYMEQLMPVLPIVRVNDVNEAIDEAIKAEQHNYHTAMMHSRDIVNLSKMAKIINTSIFVKNAPSYAGLGMTGEGFTTYTIAGPTGEGITSPVSFTRQRRCVLKDSFRII